MKLTKFTYLLVSRISRSPSLPPAAAITQSALRRSQILERECRVATSQPDRRPRQRAEWSAQTPLRTTAPQAFDHACPWRLR